MMGMQGNRGRREEAREEFIRVVHADLRVNDEYRVRWQDISELLPPHERLGSTRRANDDLILAELCPRHLPHIVASRQPRDAVNICVVESYPHAVARAAHGYL